MRFSFLFIYFSFLGLNLQAQAGIYSENDVKVQTEFIEALLAKYDKNNEKGIEHLDAVLATLPDNGAAYYERAKAYKELEDFQKAYSDVTKAIKFEGEKIPFLQLKFELETILEKWTELLVTTRSLIELQPNNIFNYYDLFNIYNKLGDDGSAVVVLEETQNRFGINDRIANSKIKIFKKSNEQAKIEKTLIDLSSAYPNELDPKYRLLDYYLEKGDQKSADQVVDDILESEPGDDRARLYIAQKNSANQGLSGLATIFNDRKIDVDKKIMQLIPYLERMSADKSTADNVLLKKYIDQLVKDYPSDAKVFAISGDFNFHTGQLEKALVEYKKTLNLNDSVFDVWAQMLVTMYYLGDIKSMYLRAEEAVDLFPNKAEAYFMYCLSSTYLSKFKLAQDYVEEGLLISTGNAYWKEKLESIAFHQLYVEGAYENALNQIQKNNALLRSDPIIIKLYGDILMEMGDNPKASKYYKQAYDLGFRSVDLKQFIDANGS